PAVVALAATGPLKVLAPLRVMLPVAVVKEAVSLALATLMVVPLAWVMAPEVVVTASVPLVTVTLPSCRAWALLRVTAPLVAFRATMPARVLALLRVMAPLAALKEAV